MAMLVGIAVSIDLRDEGFKPRPERRELQREPLESLGFLLVRAESGTAKNGKSPIVDAEYEAELLLHFLELPANEVPEGLLIRIIPQADLHLRRSRRSVSLPRGKRRPFFHDDTLGVSSASRFRER